MADDIQEWQTTNLFGDPEKHPVPNDLDQGDFRFLERTPLNSDYLTIDLLQWILILKIYQKNPDMLERLIEHREEAVTKMVNALAQAGSGSSMSAWANAHIIIQLLEHNYYVRKGGAASVVSGLNALAVVGAIKDIASAANIVFQGAGAFTKGLAAMKAAP